MVSVLEFLSSDVALVAAIALAAYAYLANNKSGMIPWEFLPPTLMFALPWLDSAATLIFYGAALYFLLPFVVGLGFPVLLTLMIALAFIYTKAFKFSLEYGAVFAIFTVILLGSGI